MCVLCYTFVLQLILEKWSNNAKYWYCFNMGFHLLFTMQLSYLAAPSIIDPRLELPITSKLDSSQLLLAVALSLFIIEEELRENVLWLYVRLQRFTLRQMYNAPRGQGKSFRDLLDTMALRRAYFRSPMAQLTLVAALLEVRISALNREIEAGHGEESLVSQVRALEEWPNICLSIAAGLAWWLLMLDAFLWSENLGVFSTMVLKMLSGDILFKFLPLYLPILLGFTTSMHAIYPQKTTHESRWSSWWQTFESLALFSLVGEAPDIASSVEGTGDIHPLDMFFDRGFRPDFAEGYASRGWSAGFFVALYVLFVLVVLLLLINLLIAMMSSTYEMAAESARLEWRVQFARLVLRYELLNLPLAMLNPKRHERRVMVGEHVMGDREYSPFRSYDKDAHQLCLDDDDGGDLFVDGEGGEGGEARPAEPAEMSARGVEAVARRLEAKLEEIVLARLGGLVAPAAIASAVKPSPPHAIGPRALTRQLGDLPPRKASTSDMEVARPHPNPHRSSISNLISLRMPFRTTRRTCLRTCLDTFLSQRSVPSLQLHPHPYPSSPSSPPLHVFPLRASRHPSSAHICRVSSLLRSAPWRKPNARPIAPRHCRPCAARLRGREQTRWGDVLESKRTLYKCHDRVAFRYHSRFKACV